MVRDPNRRRFPLADRSVPTALRLAELPELTPVRCSYIEVVDDRLTGEVLLDEALKMMKMSEKMSVGTWIDLMSGAFLVLSLLTGIPADVKRLLVRRTGETWNVMKIGYQLKQVRERLAKGLVDKGVLRTEKRNFLLFDMATHPVSDPTFKEDVLKRVLALLASRTAAVPSSNLYGDAVRYRTLRAVCMVCAAFAANVLENALVHLGYDAREAAFAKCDELLAGFSQWPYATARGADAPQTAAIGRGSSAASQETASLAEIGRLVQREVMGLDSAAQRANGSTRHSDGDAGSQTQRELHLEVVAAACEIFRRMDSLL